MIQNEGLASTVTFTLPLPGLPWRARAMATPIDFLSQ
jgi:hypothetical protein